MNNGDFVCTSPNDGTHYFRPVSANTNFLAITKL